MIISCGIPYNDGQPECRLDLFQPAVGTANGGGILFVHGGGWSGGSRRLFHPAASYFCRRGFTCMSISYRLLPTHRFPVPFDDVRLAMSVVRERAGAWGFDAQRVAACGSSAGGHLASLLATTAADDALGVTPELRSRETRPQAVLALCTVFSVMRDGYYAPQLMGCEQEGNEAVFRRASPLHRVSGGEPPFCMCVGSADRLTPVAHHEGMRAALEVHGGSAEIHVIPGEEHGYCYGSRSRGQRASLNYFHSFLQGVFDLA